MKRQALLFLILALGIICTAEWLVIFTSVSPKGAGQQTYWIFFASAFGSLSCIFSLIWYLVKSRLIYRSSNVSLGIAFRQAVLFSLVIVLTLFFKSLGILALWDLIPIALSAILIEFFFQANKSSTPNIPNTPHHETR